MFVNSARSCSYDRPTTEPSQPNQLGGSVRKCAEAVLGSPRIERSQRKYGYPCDEVGTMKGRVQELRNEAEAAIRPVLVDYNRYQAPVPMSDPEWGVWHRIADNNQCAEKVLERNVFHAAAYLAQVEKARQELSTPPKAPDFTRLSIRDFTPN